MKTVQYYSLKEFFLDENLQLLKIPDYQRAYSWESKQVEELIQDIEHIVEMNTENDIYQHFAGTIIVNKNEDFIGESGVFDIVDGQQRITTLLVLLAVIHNGGMAPNQTIVETYFGKKSKRKFASNAIDIDFFNSFVLEGQDDEVSSHSHTLLREAYFRFAEWLNSMTINDVLSVVENNIRFIIYCADSSEEVGLMFESINNRGRPLSELDKVKNYLLYLTKKHNVPGAARVIKKGWKNISIVLNSANYHGHEDEDTILRNVVIAAYDPRSKRKQGETEYSIIKTHIYYRDDKDYDEESLYDDINHFVRFLENSCKAFAALRRADNSLSENKVEKICTYLNCHDSIAPVLPLYFAINEKAPKETNENTKAELLELIEKLNFRVYGLPGVTRRSDSNQSTLFKWANTVYDQGIDCKLVYKTDDKHSSTDEEVTLDLKDALTRFTTDRCSQKKILLHLTIDDDETTEDYYYWNNIKYFLSRYEEYLRNQNEKLKRFNVYEPFKNRGESSRSNEQFSIEHFWAKEYRLATKKKIPAHIRSQQLRRLGNMVFLPRGINSSLKNISPEKKIRILDNPDKTSDVNKLEQMCELIKVYTPVYKKVDSNWNRQDVGFYTELFMALNDERETRMLYAALNLWSFEGELPASSVLGRVDSIKTKDENCHIIYPEI